ncbi:MAG: hypothetical protein JSW34_08665 [Candidatus Zixiibacteriota bacterium]|nr:MAG: hypothetical protein JSW34_08665 [candidate division Zixibacteria bacterium]
MKPSENERSTDLQLLEQVDNLNEEVKALALNLALYLAKVKSSSEELSRLEPEFIRLINGSVKVVQELALIIDAARNRETVVFDVPAGDTRASHLEIKLRSILEQCDEIVRTLSRRTDITI